MHPEEFHVCYFELKEYLINSRDKCTTFLKALTRAIKEGFPVDYVPQTNEFTLLTNSIYLRKANAAKMLLDAGASVDVMCGDKTLLICAVQTCKKYRFEFEVLESMIDRSQDINACDRYEKTAFDWLCRRFIYSDKGDREFYFPIIDKFLNAGAEAKLALASDIPKTADWAIENADVLKQYIVRQSELKKELSSKYSSCYDYEL